MSIHKSKQGSRECPIQKPELFEMDFDNDVVFVKVDKEIEDKVAMAKNAIRDCPVTAIHIKK